jgi:hypothetical protein
MLAVVFLLAAARAEVASELTLYPIGKFGEPLTACTVQSFRGKQSGERKNAFRGLNAKGLPMDRYDAMVQCGAKQVRQEVTVWLERQAEVVVELGRIMHSDPHPPHLPIRLAERDTGIEWIRLVGVYNRREETGRFDSATGEAQIIDPETGSYLVQIGGPSGIRCTTRIDFLEFTRHWTVKPSSCAFELDRYAHVLTAAEEKHPGEGPWYDEMAKELDEFYRGLEAAAKKQ